MPTYGYECVNCGNNFEVFQRISDDPLTTCEACGGTLRKRIYPVGIAFKGSGFYVNDYAPKSESASDGAAASSSETKAATETKSAEVKPEATKTDMPKAETKSETPAPAAPAS